MKHFVMNAMALAGMAFALVGLAGTASAAPSGPETSGPVQVVAAPMLDSNVYAPAECDSRAGGLPLGYLCD